MKIDRYELWGWAKVVLFLSAIFTVALTPAALEWYRWWVGTLAAVVIVIVIVTALILRTLYGRSLWFR